MRKLVLVADDEPRVLKALRNAFTRAGFEVLESSNGADALAVFFFQQSLNRPFDAVVLDIQMPLVSGPEVLHQIRKKNASVPVVMFSSALDEPYVAETLTEATCPSQKPEIAQLVRGRQSARHDEKMSTLKREADS